MPSRNKPVVHLRPPPTDHVDAVRDFIHSGPAVQQSERPDVQNARKTKRPRRQVTIYLDPELAKRLKVFAVTSGQEMSDVAAAALVRHLDSQQSSSPDA
jgi:hypothetical protein